MSTTSWFVGVSMSLIVHTMLCADPPLQHSLPAGVVTETEGGLFEKVVKDQVTAGIRFFPVSLRSFASVVIVTVYVWACVSGFAWETRSMFPIHVNVRVPGFGPERLNAL